MKNCKECKYYKDSVPNSMFTLGVCEQPVAFWAEYDSFWFDDEEELGAFANKCTLYKQKEGLED